MNAEATNAKKVNNVLRPVEDENLGRKPSYHKFEYVWRNIIYYSLLHGIGIYGFYLMFTSAQIKTMIFSYVIYQLTGLGITAGAHRLWAHRSYKAKWPLRLFLVVCNTLAFQNAVVNWARDHRMHHKFSDTDADPHNSARGFFFSHVGWLLVRKHKEIKERGHLIDMSDLYADPLLYYQKKYYIWLVLLIWFVIPVTFPIYFWSETFPNAFVLNFTRYVVTLNVTWMINSAAHTFGNKPYDKGICPGENAFLSMLVLGEGWHNYHHAFPWDYKTAELGGFRINVTSMFIDCMAKCGLAYDLKSVSPDMLEKRVKRSGDGSHHLWGWSDKDQMAEDRKITTITHRKI